MTATPSTDTPVPSSDRELVMSRLVDAPRALVYRAFTDPRMMPQWWGPNGFTTVTREVDVRPGGIWRFVMHGPDGTDYDNRIRYREVVAPERLVYSHDADVDNDPNGFEVTVTFEAEGDRTRVTMRSVFASAAMVERVRGFGAVELGLQTLGKLAARVDALRAEEGELDLVLTRLIDAPQDRVWQAWTTPALVSRFWGPRGATVLNCEMDLRPGGVFTITQRDADGSENTFNGFFAAIAAPERLAFTDKLAADGTPSPEAFLLATITLEAQGDKTLLTARVHHYTAANRDTHAELGFFGSWTEMIDRLEAVLASA
jgi:uncharacterized protein YndB with AHSA1/START domain